MLVVGTSVKVAVVASIESEVELTLAGATLRAAGASFALTLFALPARGPIATEIRHKNEISSLLPMDRDSLWFMDHLTWFRKTGE